MLETKGNLWDYLGKASVICITTNGFTKRNGEAVMGRGCASQAKIRYMGIDRILGRRLAIKGNIPFQIGEDQNTLIYSFPVKHESMCNLDKNLIVPHMQNKIKPGDVIPGWALKADIDLIAKSAGLMQALANENNWDSVILPRPGCGAGELTWSNVKPVLKELLDNRFTAITY